jgi:hypothetical protein
MPAPPNERTSIERAVRELFLAGPARKDGVARVDCVRTHDEEWDWNCDVVDGAGGWWQCVASRHGEEIDLSYSGPTNRRPARVREAPDK